MKHFPLLKNLSMVCLALATVAGVSSCTQIPSTGRAASMVKNSTSATVFSYNDTDTPRVRQCVEAGPLPVRAANAMVTWLHHSTAKHFSYTYPQYYIAFKPNKGKQVVWGVCSDAQGNLVGLMVPRTGVPAWDVPYASEQLLYVCDGPMRKELSKAIMDSLADAGYDEYRLAARQAAGLTQKKYQISKPLSDQAAARLAKIKEAEAAAAAAAQDDIGGTDDTEDTSATSSALDDMDLDDEDEDEVSTSSDDSETEEATPAADEDEDEEDE